jgi:hypothetical protein
LDDKKLEKFRDEKIPIFKIAINLFLGLSNYRRVVQENIQPFKTCNFSILCGSFFFPEFGSILDP